ncbi:hypothetical protein ONZ43_g3326 [Nemania bipapillata]|uniref:Uncharacterized protein n=1 Tax=Nemania bipapillata TaxID=110536 RepID=A0ACC2IXA9_9PEZI|nr:hypothetical protein ONZ43_g3326 [Nemania bipapillata]
MFAPSRSRALEKALSGSAITLPGFLVPAFQASPRRQFSKTPSTSSKLAKKDPTTYLKIAKRTVTVSGPLGKLDLEIPPFLTIHHDQAAGKALLSIENQELKQQKEMWGTLVGVGYRATVEDRPKKEQYPGQKFVCLKLGFTHAVEEPVPFGMKASTPQPTRILLEGIDREQVMTFAAQIRRWRRPEPYKGKGIFVNDETIKLKQRKIK